MTQDPFMNIHAASSKGVGGDGRGKVGNSPYPSSPAYRGQVTERTLWTMTVFRVYPNGIMFVDKAKSRSWFDKRQPEVKRKEKVKLDEFKTDNGVDEI